MRPPPFTSNPGFFVGKVSSKSGAGDSATYAFEEWWRASGSWRAKSGGRYGTLAGNPGVPVPGVQLAVGDYCLVRSAEGEGGLKWELSGIPGQAGAEALDGAICAWLANLGSTLCPAVTVVSASGGCSGVDATQEIYLSWGGSSWTSATNFNYGSGSGALVFTDTPSLSLAGVAGKYLGCHGGRLLFAWGNQFCAGSGSTPACDGGLVLGVDCSCCPIAGWAGPGWYCTRVSGSSTECSPEELLDADKCDSAIQICSGPYADLAGAQAACGPGLSGCPDNTKSLTFTVTGATGTCGCAAGTHVTLSVTSISGTVTQWDGGGPGVYEPCSYPVQLSVQCDSATGVVTFTATGGTPESFHTNSVSPFTATAKIDLVTVPPSLNCDGTITFSVAQP